MLRQNRQSVAFPDPVTERVEPNGSRRYPVVEAEHVDRRCVGIVHVPVVELEQALLGDEDCVTDAVVRRQFVGSFCWPTDESGEVRR
jgi:hypothetical protein